MTYKNKKIGEILEQKQLSWYWLFKNSRVKRATIYEIKNNKSIHIEFDTMEAIADALDVSLDKFRTPATMKINIKDMKNDGK